MLLWLNTRISASKRPYTSWLLEFNSWWFPVFLHNKTSNTIDVIPNGILCLTNLSTDVKEWIPQLANPFLWSSLSHEKDEEQQIDVSIQVAGKGCIPNSNGSNSQPMVMDIYVSVKYN